jgi:acetyl esterase
MQPELNASAKFERMVARALTALPARLQRRLAGGEVRIDGQVLSPELQILLEAKRRSGAPGMSDLSIAEGRDRLRRDAMLYGGAPLSVHAVRELEVDGLLARHYSCGTAGAPLLVFFHGGGFVLGDLDSHDAPCRWLCRHAGVHVLSIDYRLAPEHPFPAAVDDALRAHRWARAHAGELNADAARIVVGGDSAGANLATVVAQETRGAEAPALQLLLYPGIDRQIARPSLALFADGFLLRRKDIDWFSQLYVSGVAPAADDPRLSPLAGAARPGIAPALVVTAGFDPLRDEGEAYAAALRQSGTRVVLRRFDGLVHGFVNLVGVSADCRRALREVAHTTRRLLDAQVPPAS